VAAAIGETNGEPSSKTISSTVSIGSFSVKVHGGASWLENFIIGLFKNTIKSAAEGAISNAIATAINGQLNVLLQSLPLKIPIKDWGLLDATLTSAPTFGSDFITVTGVGALVLQSNPKPPFLNNISLPAFNASYPSMIQIYLSQYVPNSAMATATMAGKLNLVITNSDLPPNFPVSLNTNFFQYFIPALYQKFPNMNMSLNIAPMAPLPFTYFSSARRGGITLIATNRLDFSVIANGTQLIPVFSLAMPLMVSGSAFMNGTNLSASINNASTALKLISSHVGSFDVSPISTIFSLAFSNVIVPMINIVLQQGIAIPLTPNVQLQDVSLQYGNGYITILGDVVRVVPPPISAVDS
jgi:hypothetical protein